MKGFIGLTSNEKEDILKQHSKQYYESNPEYFKEAFNQTYLNNKSLHTTVYLLPDHNYVGITNTPYYRMIVHRNDYKRNTDNWIEIARYSNREDALKHEALLHSQGYAGAK
jgi:hypothetical protein